MQGITFTVPGRLPGLNEIITAAKKQKHGYSPYNKMKAETQLQITNAIARAKVPPMTDIHLQVTWIEPRRNRDKDNVAAGKKFILDALVDSGVLDTDGWANVASFTDKFDVDAKNPRVEVTVFGRVK